MKHTVEVLVKSKPIKQYHHEGKTFVEGRKGSEYSLKIRNNTLFSWSRLLAVISIDGINVINGQPASDDNKMGYIINACDTLDVKGFRKDTESVGAFKFCDKDQAYSEEVGVKGNTGVIGVRLYNEAAKFRQCSTPMWTPFYVNDKTEYLGEPNITPTCYSSNILRSSDRSIKSKGFTSSVDANPFDVGTTWGESKKDKVVTVEFETGTLNEEILIYYTSMKGLKKLGIKIEEEKAIAFPKAFGTFATPPKGWNG